MAWQIHRKQMYLCTHRKRYIENERTCLIWFHSSPNIATSGLPYPLSAICLGTHVQTHIVIIAFVIFDCFLYLSGHVRNSRTNSSYWTVFTGFWTFGNKCSWMSTLSRNKQRKHTLSFRSQGESTSTDLPSPQFLRNRIKGKRWSVWIAIANIL